MGYKAFDIEPALYKAWEDAGTAWAENAAFIQAGIDEGAEFVLATKQNLIREGSNLVKEIDMLLKAGYKWNSRLGSYIK
jgi:hypothetical protein